MKSIVTNPDGFESTYALLMRSEEKQRSRFETAVYAVLIASTVFAVSEAGRQAIAMPSSIARVTTVGSVAARHGA